MQSWEPDPIQEPDPIFVEWETDPTFRKWNADACNNTPTLPPSLISSQGEVQEENTKKDDEESEGENLGEDLDEDSKAIILMAIEKALLYQEYDRTQRKSKNLDKDFKAITLMAITQQALFHQENDRKQCEGNNNDYLPAYHFGYQKDTNGIYPCLFKPCPNNRCTKIYHTKKAFENHITSLKRRFYVKPYTCPLCFNISYANPSGISSHVLKSHKNEKFICKICAHQSMTAIKLLYHYYRDHEGIPKP